MRIKSPHNRNENFRRIRNGLRAMRDASGVSSRDDIIKAHRRLEGVDLRGSKDVRKGLDDAMNARKGDYHLNRLLDKAEG